MSDVAKFDIQLLYHGSLYKVGLREADANDSMKFHVAGRSVTPFEYSPLPFDLKEVFSPFDKAAFSSEKDLMKRLKKVGADIHCLSVTKKVYELGTFRLLQSQTTESKFGRETKEKTYQALRSCLSSDRASISQLIGSSTLPDSTLFEIADRIEQDDRNVLLAHAVRDASRRFNLESAVEHICDSLKNCIKEESAAQMAAGLRKNLQNGNYERIYEDDDFAQVVTQDLQEISHNRHVFVMSKPPANAEANDAPADAERIRELEAANFGFAELRTPNEGIAYVDIRSFENPKELVGNKPLARDFAMGVLKQIVDSKPKALIIDLRNHGGGSVYMSELMLSHFLEEGLPLTGFEYKVAPKGEELLSFPLEPCQTWSYEKLPKEKRLLDVPIFVLTSRDTFSAGEDMACHLKERNRAILIGQTTGGGGDPNKLFDAHEFLVAMPVGFAKVPYGPSWEGVGVSPHIQLESGQDALLVASRLIEEKK